MRTCAQVTPTRAGRGGGCGGGRGAGGGCDYAACAHATSYAGGGLDCAAYAHAPARSCRGLQTEEWGYDAARVQLLCYVSAGVGVQTCWKEGAMVNGCSREGAALFPRPS